MDQGNHTGVDWSKVRDQVARESRPLDDPAANYPLAARAHQAHGEGAQRRADR